MQIQLLLSELETITHFLSPGKDFVKCELAGWVVKHVWAILVSFGQTSLGALSCKINYCASFINVLAIIIIKKYCLCFPEMKLCYNVTFPINTESLCMPIDPPVVIATWTSKPLRSCCYGSPWNSWRLYLERFCGKRLFWSYLDPKSTDHIKRGEKCKIWELQRHPSGAFTQQYSLQLITHKVWAESCEYLITPLCLSLFLRRKWAAKAPESMLGRFSPRVYLVHPSASHYWCQKVLQDVQQLFHKKFLILTPWVSLRFSQLRSVSVLWLGMFSADWLIRKMENRVSINIS